PDEMSAVAEYMTTGDVQVFSLDAPPAVMSPEGDGAVQIYPEGGNRAAGMAPTSDFDRQRMVTTEDPNVIIYPFEDSIERRYSGGIPAMAPPSAARPTYRSPFPPSDSRE